jgi:hypothetical protein
MPPKKKATVIAPPVVEAVPPVAPEIASTITPQEIGKLGEREHQIVVEDKPVQEGMSQGGVNLMRFETGVKKAVFRQPYLITDEVRKLGTRHWWPHRVTGEFTTVVNGTRFIVTAATFEDCKNLGLIIGCEVRDAHKHRS